MADKSDNEHGALLDLNKLLAESNKTAIEKPDEYYATHLSRMVALGMNPATSLVNWIGKRNPALTRVAIALPESIGGYYIGRVPSLSDRHNAQQIQNAPATDDEHGAFDALCRFFLDCSLWCAPLTPAQMIEQWPGAVVAIAMKVRDIGTDSFVLEQKK